MMSSSRDTAQRASDLSALILTAGVIGVSLLVRPFQWREQGPRTPADQPVELSVEDPPDTTPTPPAPPPRLVPHEIVTRVPVPEVPDPVTLTDDPMPESAVVVAALNPSPSGGAQRGPGGSICRSAARRYRSSDASTRFTAIPAAPCVW
jgi:hypothetical protein